MRTNTLKNATYWMCTGLLGLDFVVGGAFQIARSPEAVQGFAHLGYPAYFMTLLGVWKILGGLVLLVPGLPRLKEWAYAGIFFDVSAAVVSMIAVGDSWTLALLPLAFVMLTIASWTLRPMSRTLTALSSRNEDGAALGSSIDAAA